MHMPISEGCKGTACSCYMISFSRNKSFSCNLYKVCIIEDSVISLEG